MDVRLRFVKGPFAGETIPMLPGKLLIGRAKDCQLRLDSNLVSTHHCVLLLDEYALRIRDLGSKNGTIVNGIRIGTHETILVHDDRVSIDQLTFEIDLGESAESAILADADVQPFSHAALEDTGIIEGDTGRSIPADTVPIDTVPTDTVPTDTAWPPSPDVLRQSDPSPPEAAPVERAGVLLQAAAPIGLERRVATSTSPVASTPRTPPRKGERKSVAGPAAAVTNQVEQSAATPKQIVKAKPAAAGKVGQTAKKSSASRVRSQMAVAGLIALVAIVGGGAFLLRGPSQEAPYAVPQNFVLFNPKIYATMLSCEVPEDWKQQIRGGQNVGPIAVRFTDSRLSMEICENLTRDGIRELAVALRQKPDAARSDASLAQLIHEHQRQQTSEKFKSYSEEPRSRGIKTKGFGEGAISDFTAREGIFGTEIRGCRATVVNSARQFTVTCKCPPSLFQDARPVFEKVISTLNCGVVARE
jgi:FHA domain